jgi:hypothetical protein
VGAGYRWHANRYAKQEKLSLYFYEPILKEELVCVGFSGTLIR